MKSHALPQTPNVWIYKLLVSPMVLTFKILTKHPLDLTLRYANLWTCLGVYVSSYILPHWSQVKTIK